MARLLDQPGALLFSCPFAGCARCRCPEIYASVMELKGFLLSSLFSPSVSIPTILLPLNFSLRTGTSWPSVAQVLAANILRAPLCAAVVLFVPLIAHEAVSEPQFACAEPRPFANSSFLLDLFHQLLTVPFYLPKRVSSLQMTLYMIDGQAFYLHELQDTLGGCFFWPSKLFQSLHKTLMEL